MGGATRWRHLPAAAMALLFVAPLAVMVLGSLRQAGLPPPDGLALLPSPPAWGNYQRTFQLVDLPRYALNSGIVVAFAVPITIVVASWAGLAIARLPGRAAAWLVGLSLAALMVPVTALLVPRFALFRTLSLTDTFVPLVAPALIGTSPLYVLLYAWAFRRIPGELLDAARLEGLSAFGTWRRVAMPLVRPVTLAVAVLAFVATWSSFLDPLIYLSDERMFTLPLGLRALGQLDAPRFPLFLAGAVAATAPVVVAFAFLQRFFLREERWLAS